MGPSKELQGFLISTMQVAIESIENMRTVASLTKEEKFHYDYCQKTLQPYK